VPIPLDVGGIMSCAALFPGVVPLGGGGWLVLPVLFGVGLVLGY